MDKHRRRMKLKKKHLNGQISPKPLSFLHRTRFSFDILSNLVHDQQRIFITKNKHSKNTLLQKNLKKMLKSSPLQLDTQDVPLTQIELSLSSQSSFTSPISSASSSSSSPSSSSFSSISNNSSPICVPTKKFTSSNCCKILKKNQNLRMRKVKRQEYNKLREMVPSLQEKNNVSKVVVIEEAIKYIDELHSALVQRFKSRTSPTTFNGVYLDPREVDRGNIRELVRRLLANANPNSLPPARIENVRTTPSFLQKLPKHRRTT
ncbi:UNVERIFIED_CONTAM: hypothetical protein RMT77_012880 [Armadillidium vulgare]